MLSPRERYQRDLQAGLIVADDAQAEVIDRLDALSARLVSRAAGERTLGGRLRNWLGRPRLPERGIYLWGGVGRGKTHLMDTFFDALPCDRKLRVHFHRFMQRVHRALTDHAGEANPLERVADDIAKDAAVLCFDEFFVSDIGDAMILGGLVDALLHRGVTLVATSNIPPAELYRDGLQRNRFLPAIALLEAHCEVLHLDSVNDYRFRTLQRADLWHVPHDQQASEALADYYESLAGQPASTPVALEINKRSIQAVGVAPGVAWFTFKALCEEPRSASDFVEIAREYHSVLVEGVPVMSADKEDAARRFINMIDEFYDRNVKLIATAAALPEAIYEGNRLRFEFERTQSRLQEMRTHEYLRAEHRA